MFGVTNVIDGVSIRITKSIDRYGYRHDWCFWVHLVSIRIMMHIRFSKLGIETNLYVCSL